MVSPKKQDFWPKINTYTQRKPLYFENTGSATQVRQKLSMILENKVVQKLKLENNIFLKSGLLN